MKILSRAQVYEADAITAQRQKITSTELMERAGIQLFNWLHVRMQGAQVPIHIFCGIGNNGGDGLVLGRHLINHGYNVKVFVVNYSNKRSKDFLINYDLIKQASKKWPTLLEENSGLPLIHKDDIIIDAVFGIGLNRPADAWVKKLFQHFKVSGAFTVSVDIPSGLFTDKVPSDTDGVVYANHTLSFQAPKLIFFLPQTAKYTVQWEVLDIGLDAQYLYEVETEAELIGKMEAMVMYKPREKFSHKGTYGHVLFVGGSYGKVGAAMLSSKASISSGGGLVTALVPKCGYIPFQSSLPEAMVITDKNENHLTKIAFDIKPTVLAMGPGMGMHTETLSAFENFLKENKWPLVIDADALNMVSDNIALLKWLPENTILTPHAKELERLIGSWENDFDKLQKAKAFSKKHKIILVLKGANTITVYGNKLYVNSTGNPGMATAGAGDVLTGIIAGLRAQGYDPLTASVFGVYLHGRAGDLAAAVIGYNAVLASHLIDFLSDAYVDLFKQPEQPEAEETEEPETDE